MTEQPKPNDPPWFRAMLAATSKQIEEHEPERIKLQWFEAIGARSAPVEGEEELELTCVCEVPNIFLEDWCRWCNCRKLFTEAENKKYLNMQSTRADQLWRAAEANGTLAAYLEFEERQAAKEREEGQLAAYPNGQTTLVRNTWLENMQAFAHQMAKERTGERIWGKSSNGRTTPVT